MKKVRLFEKMKTLLIEDDKTTANFVAKGFREAGMIVDVCHDGLEGLDMALVNEYDVAVIDLMLPGLDGLSIIEQMRSNRINTPVLILSARHTVSDRIEGLKNGGDDYLVKPFSFSELLVRVQALVRRSSIVENQGSDGILKTADLELDPWKHEVRRGGRTIPLKPKEFALLEYLVRHPDRVISKTLILENVYDYSFDPQTNVVDVLVCRLRTAIDKDFDRKLIQTVRGMGYVFKSD